MELSRGREAEKRRLGGLVGQTKLKDVPARKFFIYDRMRLGLNSALAMVVQFACGNLSKLIVSTQTPFPFLFQDRNKLNFSFLFEKFYTFGPKKTKKLFPLAHSIATIEEK